MGIWGLVGTYTEEAGGRGKGVYTFTFDGTSGALHDLSLAAETVNPSFLAWAPSKDYLYAVNEVNEFAGKPGGAVSSFALERATLAFINQVPSCGQGPCHIAPHPNAPYVVVSNYASATIGVLPVKADGALGAAVQTIVFTGSGPVAERQEAAHAHFFMFDKTGAYGFACDLGSDTIHPFSFNQTLGSPLSKLPPFSVESGSGPRHGVFHPSKNIIYIVNELAATIDVLTYWPSLYSFYKQQTLSTLPLTVSVNASAAAIKLSAPFLYVSNRGFDSISVYRIGTNGFLTYIQTFPSGGKTPRDFAIDPTGNFLIVCHQDSDNLVVFRIDRTTGLLEKTGEYALPSGVCILLR